MNLIEQLATAALARDSLRVRSLVLELLATYPKLENVPQPDSSDERERAIAAGLIELLAMRRNQSPPSWTKDAVGNPAPFFLLQFTQTMPRLRQLCEQESPEPLKRRLFYAPPNFLEFA